MISIFIRVGKTIANIALLVIFFFQNLIVYAQDTSLKRSYDSFNKTFKKTEILIGGSLQGNWSDKVKAMRYVEIGLAKSVHMNGRHGPVSLGVYAAEEIHFAGRNTIYGTKLGAYTHYLFDLGMTLVYYTNFKEGNLKLRPEFGIGMGLFRAVAGFNIPTINNKEFELLRLNNAQLSVQFLIPVKKIELKDKNEGIFRLLFKK